MKFQIMATFGTTAEDTARCFWLNADTYFAPRSLATQIKWMEDRPDMATVFLELSTAQRWMSLLARQTKAVSLTMKIDRK